MQKRARESDKRTPGRAQLFAVQKQYMQPGRTALITGIPTMSVIHCAAQTPRIRVGHEVDTYSLRLLECICTLPGATRTGPVPGNTLVPILHRSREKKTRKNNNDDIWQT